MGFVKEIVSSVDSSSDVSSEIKETLNILMNLAEAKTLVFETEIEKDLQMGKTSDKNLNISVTKVIQKKSQCRAKTSQEVPFVEKIQEALKNLFSSDPKIFSAVSDVINSSLQLIIGTGEGTQSIVKVYEVVAEYPAIVRFDFWFWGQNIKSESLKKHMESVFSCVAYKSAVDVQKLTFNEFLSLYGTVLNKAFGAEHDKIKDFIAQSQEIYKLLKEEDTSLGAPISSHKDTSLEAPLSEYLELVLNLSPDSSHIYHKLI
ncbi:hypothetical protein [Okeania sp.]|uniref:hypothetical protein n=1 Tax=Okeania sp. TaxID=3100323 RepID=UPI002B4B6E9A|nr:hypothetical protein [Okeania sp.]MEB3341769.1 hypothetical protein [Okeania sp.]